MQSLDQWPRVQPTLDITLTKRKKSSLHIGDQLAVSTRESFPIIIYVGG